MVLGIGHILIISFLFLTTINCLVTYFCSSSALKEFENTASYSKGINRIRVYDTYILNTITLVTSAIYVVLSYFYFLDIMEVSDYFLTLSISLGFVLALITTFFSRLCYCYACNVLLKTDLNEYECFVENFAYLLRIFFPIFFVSFLIPTIYVLNIEDVLKKILVTCVIAGYLICWVVFAPYKSILNLNARKIQSDKLRDSLSKLFIENDIKKYKLYYWDSSRTNEANALVSGFNTYYLFVSTSLIEALNEKELEAVILHEIGHIKNNHFTKILVSRAFLFLSLSIILYYTIAFNKMNVFVLFGLVFAFILAMGINLKGSKKYEDEADLYVNSKGYGKYLISALKKVSLDDTYVNKVDEFFSTHPDINKRIDKLNRK